MTTYGQPTGDAQTPQMGQPATVGVTTVTKKKRSPLLIIGGILLGLMLVCGVGFFMLGSAVMTTTQPVATAGDGFMTALKDRDFNKAYDMSAPSLQQEVGNAQGLEAPLSSKQPVSWNFTSRAINNGQGTLSGTTTYKTGETGTVDMVLTQAGNDWKVAGISLK